jgi:hypothetical protein
MVERAACRSSGLSRPSPSVSNRAIARSRAETFLPAVPLGEWLRWRTALSDELTPESFEVSADLAVEPITAEIKPAQQTVQQNHRIKRLSSESRMPADERRASLFLRVSPIQSQSHRYQTKPPRVRRRICAGC